MCDCLMPTVFKESKRKAKKQHECCECGCTIDNEMDYFVLQGLWDSQWKNYKQCANCNLIGNKLMDYSGECYLLGDLIQELHNSDLIENQGDEDDNPIWVSHVDWLKIENHNPLKISLAN